MDSITPELSAALTEIISKAVESAVQKALAPLAAQIAAQAAQIDELSKTINEKTTSIRDLESRNLQLQSDIIEKTNTLEQYSRKDCLRLDGFPISPNEDNASLQATVITKLHEMGVEIGNSDIFRMHRSGKPYPMNKFKTYLNRINEKNENFDKIRIDDNDNTQTSQVIMKFTNWNARSKVYQLHYDKDIRIKVKCDLTKTSLDIISTARQHLADKDLAGYVYNDAECRLMLVDKSTSNRKSFSSFLQFKEMCNVLMSNDELSEDANQDAPRGRTRAGSRGTGRSGARGPGGHRGQRNRSGTRGGRGGRGGLG